MRTRPGGERDGGPGMGWRPPGATLRIMLALVQWRPATPASRATLQSGERAARTCRGQTRRALCWPWTARLQGKCGSGHPSTPQCSAVDRIQKHRIQKAVDGSGAGASHQLILGSVA